MKCRMNNIIKNKSQNIKMILQMIKWINIILRKYNHHILQIISLGGLQTIRITTAFKSMSLITNSKITIKISTRIHSFIRTNNRAAQDPELIIKSPVISFKLSKNNTSTKIRSKINNNISEIKLLKIVSINRWDFQNKCNRKIYNHLFRDQRK